MNKRIMKNDESENIEKKDQKKDTEEKSVEIKESIDPNSPISASGSGVSNNGGNNIGDDDNRGDDGSKGDKPLVNTKTGLYTPFLAIPMKDRPCLPGRYCTITVTDPEVIRCLQEVVETKEPYFVLFHVRDPNDPDAHIDIIKNKEFVHEIGTLCQIAKVTPLDSTHVHILAYPHRRVKLVDLSTPKVKSENIEQQHDNFPTAYLKSMEYHMLRFSLLKTYLLRKTMWRYKLWLKVSKACVLGSHLIHWQLKVVERCLITHQCLLIMLVDLFVEMPNKYKR